MKIHPSITADRVIDAVHRRGRSLDNPGFYLSCGKEAFDCEPDARKYTCDHCEQDTVYGAEEILMTLV